MVYIYIWLDNPLHKIFDKNTIQLQPYRPFQEKMCACAMNRTPNQDLNVQQVCCYSQVLI